VNPKFPLLHVAAVGGLAVESPHGFEHTDGAVAADAGTQS
jgi:hypothetical protein